MKKTILLLLLCLCSTMSVHAKPWHGKNPPYGKPSYHQRCEEVHVIESRPRYRDNGSAIAGAVLAGTLLGVLLYDTFVRKPTCYYPQDYYDNGYTTYYEYR